MILQIWACVLYFPKIPIDEIAKDTSYPLWNLNLSIASSIINSNCYTRKLFTI